MFLVVLISCSDLSVYGDGSTKPMGMGGGLSRHICGRLNTFCSSEGRNEIFYLTTHFIYGCMASDIW